MSVNFQNGYPNAYYTSSVSNASSRNTSGTSSVFGESEKSNKATSAIAVGVGALAIGTTIYAFVKGRKALKNNGEKGGVIKTLSEGFKSIWNGIKNHFGKAKDAVDDATKATTEAATGAAQQAATKATTGAAQQAATEAGK